MNRRSIIQWGSKLGIAAVALVGASCSPNSPSGGSALEGGANLTGQALSAGEPATPAGLREAYVQSLIAEEQGKLIASDAPGDRGFGVSIALSGDTALVGACLNDPMGTAAGAAYVFVRNSGVWTEQAKLLASDGVADDAFGASVALNGDIALIGAPGYYIPDAGAAYVFVRSGGVWTEQTKLVASDVATDDNFGVSVAFNGDTAVVGAGFIGAGLAYVFTRSGVTWTEQAKLAASDGQVGDYFGTSVALSEDGNTALVGAAWADTAVGMDAGSAYAFVRNGGVWTEQAKLVASDSAAKDYFGWVAVSGDTAVIGAFFKDTTAINGGAAYMFVRNGGAWTEQAKLVPGMPLKDGFFGNSVALTGDTALIGAYNYGSTSPGNAYVFTRSGGVWTEDVTLAASDGFAMDWFGTSVALSGDTAAVGAYSASTPGNTYGGAAYAFILRTKYNGEPCASSTECESGFCADGVCCDSACGGGATADCEACSVTAGAMSDGTCAPRSSGTVCRQAAGQCDSAETCDGMTAICPGDTFLPDGTPCTNGICMAGACEPNAGAGGTSGSSTGGSSTGGSSTGGSSTGGSGGAIAKPGPADGGVEGGCGCRVAEPGDRRSMFIWLALAITRAVRARRRHG